MKTEKIKLGDSKEYTITEFDVGDFIEIEEKYGNLQLQEGKIGPIIYWFWLAIRKVHKELTLKQLYSLLPASFVTKGGINDIFSLMSRLNGWEEANLKNVQGPVAEKPA